MPTFLRVLIAAAAVCSTSCGYLHDRVNDLLDPFRVDVGVGPGLYADARVTDFLAVGAGGHRLQTAGVHGRFVGTDTRDQIGVPVFGILGDVLDPTMAPLLGDASVFAAERDLVPSQMFFLFPSMRAGRTGLADWRRANRGIHVADVGVSATAVVGLSVGFSPGECLDLLLGCVGVDIAGDDVAGREASAASSAPSP